MISLNNIIVRIKIRDCIDFEKWKCIQNKVPEFDYYYNNIVDKREKQNFFSNSFDIPIVVFDPINNKYCNNYELNINPYYFSLCNKSLPYEYYDSHPPTYVYELYAKELKQYLINNKLVE